MGFSCLIFKKHTIMQRLLFILIFIVTNSILAQDITGTWNGEIKVRDKKVSFIFNISKTSEYNTILDIPTARLNGITAKTTSFKNGKLIVDMSNVGMVYEGLFNSTTNQIEGKVTEGLNSFSLKLTKEKIAIEEIKKRPQEPVKPYPYLEEEVRFQNEEAGVTLVGTLTLPKTGVSHPTVILINGSGPQDRDETIAGHKPFLVLADHLTRNGIAVLRYDDRGFGKSTGNHSEATTHDFAKDVLSAVSYLKSRTDIDSKNIGLIGHSEGGIIAPLVVNQSKDISFMVSLAGTGISGTELSVMQAKAFRGFPVPDEEAYEKAIRKAIEIAGSNRDITLIKKELRMHYNNTTVPIIKNLGVPETRINEMIDGIIETRTSIWTRNFYHYNPADEYEKITCPVLSLNGSKDTQVEAKINQDGIRNALIKGENQDFKILELPNLNHLFQECKTGAISEYSSIEQTFAPIALEEISNWILKHI